MVVKGVWELLGGTAVLQAMGLSPSPLGGPPSPAGWQVVGPGSSLGVSLQPCWTSVLSVVTGLPKAQQDPQRSPRACQCPVGQREDSLIAGPGPVSEGSVLLGPQRKRGLSERVR